MKKINLWKAATILLAAVMMVSFVLLSLPASKKIEGQKSNDSAIALVKPLFMSNVSAVDNGTNFLQQEAGISVYTNSGQTIDINTVKSIFRTIEYQTTDYVIGSVALPNYPETEDVHVYVHKSGWIVAYYLREEPAAKIVDWNNYGTDEKIKGTKLEDGLGIVCSIAGVPIGNPQYYDFKYPNANKLMIVVDAAWEVNETDTFNIKLPSSFTFYEYSYSHCHRNDAGPSDMYLDENEIDHIGGYGTHYGLLSAAQLPANIFHTVKVNHWYGPSFDAIVLIYSE